MSRLTPIVSSVAFGELAGRFSPREDRPVNAHFWWAAPVAIAASAAGFDLTHIGISVAAIALIIAAGLPHGAHDLALARHMRRLDPLRLTAVFIAYLAVAAAMALLWWGQPLIALTLFLLSSTLHFADDWHSLPDGMLRMCAGASVIGAAAIGNPVAVETIFAAMAGPDSVWLVRIAIAAAPVVLLVTAVAIGIALRDGQRSRPLAMAIALIALMSTPPLVGFALYFALVHAPWHMMAVRRMLGDQPVSVLVSAPVMTTLALALWASAAPMVAPAIALIGDASLFMLLSIVAVPHLLCSHWLDHAAPDPRGAAARS
jgi:beta-carotene 15,15'-dioxygenase